MILMPLLGCGTQLYPEPIEPWSEVPYDRAREACGLDVDDALPLGGEASEGCLAHMAEDVGLRLDDAQDDDDRGHAAYVLSGLLTVLAANQGAASALLDERMPSLLRERAGSHDGGPETPAAAFWYWLLANEIEELLLDPTLAALGNSDGSGTVTIRPMETAPLGTGPDGEMVWPPLEIFSASVLVHEASHGIVPWHSESCDAHCDRTVNGAYGMAAAWSYGWIIDNGNAVPDENCAGAVRRMQVECGQIEEPGFPCTEGAELFASCEM